MYGAILGDIIGSVYKETPIKKKDFKLLNRDSKYTDDTIIAISVAKALTEVDKNADEETIKTAVMYSMKFFVNKFYNVDHGIFFNNKWLNENYKSYRNGSEMFISPVGWIYDDIHRTREVARWIAEITNNDTEGIQNAESVASAIFLARNGKSKDDIKKYIEDNFNYNLSRSLDEIRKSYESKISCQQLVADSIIAFLESDDFEDAIRNAVSLGGDANTQAAMSGSIAEAFYGIPYTLKIELRNIIGLELIEILYTFEKLVYNIKEPIKLDLTENLINKKFCEDIMYFHAALGGPYCEGYIAMLNTKGEFYTGSFLEYKNNSNMAYVVDNGLLMQIEDELDELPGRKERNKNGWTYFYLGYKHVLYVKDKVIDSFCKILNIDVEKDWHLQGEQWLNAGMRTIMELNNA